MSETHCPYCGSEEGHEEYCLPSSLSAANAKIAELEANLIDAGNARDKKWMSGLDEIFGPCDWEAGLSDPSPNTPERKWRALQKRNVELEAKLTYAEDAAEKGRLARENAGGMEERIVELTSKCEKLTDYLAHEATLNCELEATIEKMRELIGTIEGIPHSGAFTYDPKSDEMKWISPCDCATCQALSLTPSSALLAHDLELAERAWVECAEIFLVCRSGQERAMAAKQTFRDSQTRRSLTKGKEKA